MKRIYKLHLLSDSVKQSLLIQLEQRSILFIFNKDNVIFTCEPIVRAVLLSDSGVMLGGDGCNAIAQRVRTADHMLLAHKTNCEF